MVEEADSRVGNTVVTTDGLLVPRLRATIVVARADRVFIVEFLRSGHHGYTRRYLGSLVRGAKSSVLAVVGMITKDGLDI